MYKRSKRKRVTSVCVTEIMMKGNHLMGSRGESV